MTKEKFKVYNGVFDEFTLSELELLKRKKYYDALLDPIKTGKEGDVYLANKVNNGNKELRAIKIYRVTSSNFKKISTYIHRDYRFKSIRGNPRKVIMAWCQKEYRNLLNCHKKNMNVPFPFKHSNNIIIMEYIDGEMLKDSEILNPKEFLNELIGQLYLLKNEVGLVHGDLSEYNILVKDQTPFIIDLGQSMSFKNEEDFKKISDLYDRDLKNIINYFKKKYDLELNLEDFKKRIDNFSSS